MAFLPIVSFCSRNTESGGRIVKQKKKKKKKTRCPAVGLRSVRGWREWESKISEQKKKKKKLMKWYKYTLTTIVVFVFFFFFFRHAIFFFFFLYDARFSIITMQSVICDCSIYSVVYNNMLIKFMHFSCIFLGRESFGPSGTHKVFLIHFYWF